MLCPRSVTAPSREAREVLEAGPREFQLEVHETEVVLYGSLFADGFETGRLDAWPATVP